MSLSSLFGRSGLPALLLAGLAACSTVAQAATYTMYRDAGCGCCLKWAEHVEQGMKVEVKAENSPDMQALKDAKGVPLRLRACHTMIADGYVIEGHVPAEAIERLLDERPEGVTGIAVAGMPMGSPGMEHPTMREPFRVIAFGPGGERLFATYD